VRPSLALQAGQGMPAAPQGLPSGDRDGPRRPGGHPRNESRRSARKSSEHLAEVAYDSVQGQRDDQGVSTFPRAVRRGEGIAGPLRPAQPLVGIRVRCIGKCEPSAINDPRAPAARPRTRNKVTDGDNPGWCATPPYPAPKFISMPTKATRPRGSTGSWRRRVWLDRVG
jgi:hypothetical protein